LAHLFLPALDVIADARNRSSTGFHCPVSALAEASDPQTDATGQHRGPGRATLTSAALGLSEVLGKPLFELLFANAEYVGDLVEILPLLGNDFAVGGGGPHEQGKRFLLHFSR
jgi:hypothetical protein